MRTEVTIGIPVYKSRKYIEQTMNSVLSQTFQGIEFLIVDDCGNDGSVDMIRSFQLCHSRGNEIRILHNDSNFGVSYSRNRIIDEAQGRYLYFLDSDDTIEPDTIQILYESIIANNAQISYGSYEIVDVLTNSVQKYQKPSISFDGDYELAKYAFENINIFHVSVCNSLISVAFLRDTGIRFIDTSYWEDMAFSTELAIKVKKAVLVSKITYHYLHHSDSLSHSKKREKCLRDEINSNIDVLNYLKRKVPVGKKDKYVPYLCYNLGVNSFYLVCNILKKKNDIIPQFNCREIHNILEIPLSLFDIFLLKDKKVMISFFWLLSVIPASLSLLFIRILAKIKKTI